MYKQQVGRYQLNLTKEKQRRRSNARLHVDWRQREPSIWRKESQPPFSPYHRPPNSVLIHFSYLLWDLQPLPSSLRRYMSCTNLAPLHLWRNWSWVSVNHTVFGVISSLSASNTDAGAFENRGSVYICLIRFLSPGKIISQFPANGFIWVILWRSNYG